MPAEADATDDSLRPWGDEENRRIEMTCRCRDCDEIPKVDGAGDVFSDADGHWQRMHNGVRIAEGCYHGAPRWPPRAARGAGVS
jgi:hypothetical protein